MDKIQEMVDSLEASDDTLAYQSLQKLLHLSEEDSQAASFCPDFARMLQNKKSYERIRGAMLLAANARWLKQKNIAEWLPDYLLLTMDEKPTVARKALEGLYTIVKAHPDLSEKVKSALKENDYSNYKDTMRPLLEKATRKILDLV